MKYVTTLMIIMFSILHISASSITVTSDITTNTIWEADTVFIDKPDFTIHRGSRLTIAPGTTVKFVMALRFITVRGAITAIGTASDSIRFSHNDPRITWQGIRLTGREHETATYDSSYIKYCSIVNINTTITDSLYMKRGGALYCGAGNYVELGNSLIANCKGYHGGAVYVDSGSIVSVIDCEFFKNTANIMGGGAIRTCENGPADLQVWNCLFHYNYARPGGAVMIGKGIKAEFNNCVFYRDTTQSINPHNLDLGGAIAIKGPADVVLRGCIIFHCSSYEKGGGIYSSDAPIKLINCTLVGNASVYGGGIYFERNSEPYSPILINTIVDGSTLYNVKMPCDSAGCGIFIDSLVTPVFQYCQFGDTIYDHTITQYTKNFINSQYGRARFAFREKRDFYDTLVTGYQLDRRDPGVDGGTPDTTGLGLPEFDLLGQKRIFGDAVDIGAIEYNDSLVKVMTIPGKIRKPQSDVNCNSAVIYTISGRKVGTFTGNFSLTALHEMAGRKLPDGMYIVSLSLSDRQPRQVKLLIK